MLELQPLALFFVLENDMEVLRGKGTEPMAGPVSVQRGKVSVPAGGLGMIKEAIQGAALASGQLHGCPLCEVSTSPALTVPGEVLACTGLRCSLP